MKIIDFYYFTGTGNTLLVLKKMKEVFEKNNIKVNLFQIEKEDPEKINTEHTIGLAFPVAGQSTYPFVWDFILNLPNVDETEIFMVDTLQKLSGAIVGPLKKILNQFGYKTIGAKEIMMPGNWIWFPKILLPKENSEDIIKKGLAEAEKYAQSLVDGTTTWKSQSFIADFFYSISTSKLVWKFFANLGKKFTVDHEKCSKCKICVQLCPVDNIIMNEFPQFKDICQQCMRCVAFCPKEAIIVKNKKYKTYRAVDIKELLK